MVSGVGFLMAEAVPMNQGKPGEAYYNFPCEPSRLLVAGGTGPDKVGS